MMRRCATTTVTVAVVIVVVGIILDVVVVAVVAVIAINTVVGLLQNAVSTAIKAVVVAGVVVIVVIILILLREGVLVIVHPHLENSFVDADFAAKLQDHLLVPLLHLPPNSFRELVHLFLLILAELGPEPLPAARARRHSTCTAGA